MAPQMSRRLKERLEELKSKLEPEFIVMTKAIENGEVKGKEYYIIIVTEKVPDKPKDRIRALKDILGDLTEELDIYTYKLLEFKSLLTRKQPYIIKAIEEGEVIYDKGAFQRIREAIQQGLKQIVINEETIWDLR